MLLWLTEKKVESQRVCVDVCVLFFRLIIKIQLAILHPVFYFNRSELVFKSIAYNPAHVSSISLPASCLLLFCVVFSIFVVCLSVSVSCASALASPFLLPSLCLFLFCQASSRALSIVRLNVVHAQTHTLISVLHSFRSQYGCEIK